VSAPPGWINEFDQTQGETVSRAVAVLVRLPSWLRNVIVISTLLSGDMQSSPAQSTMKSKSLIRSSFNPSSLAPVFIVFRAFIVALRSFALRM
jgi:hypothetical protein